MPNETLEFIREIGAPAFVLLVISVTLYFSNRSSSKMTTDISENSSKMYGRTIELSKENSELSGKVGLLTGSVERLEAALLLLRVEVDRTKVELEAYKSEREFFKTEILQLQKSLSVVQRKLDASEKSNKELVTENHALRKQIDELTTRINLMDDEITSPVTVVVDEQLKSIQIEQEQENVTRTTATVIASPLPPD